MLKVNVTGLRPRYGGSLRVNVYENEETWKTSKFDEALRSERREFPPDAKEDGLSMIVEVEGLTAGKEYGVFVVHDKKDNGKMDSNWIGIPTDGVSCSNGAKGGPLGGPKWAAAKFLIPPVAADKTVEDEDPSFEIECPMVYIGGKMMLS